ncbi:3-hydroxyacyl-CoA dehydrogenase NAD-binding domain-containing protein [Sphingomonas montana]|uniref:3-hydroxyacyl-CoA dehydrogenase NAD-binding domain-containing protein n=1 Tax=Sphingomonas montana TaxID=1843236 RepID=UPI00096FCF51|nr:3-hydroxyacyl-CoA dehydrogenase NAD-binding domain-containing protein [Sphingomonas montana]
MSPITTRREGDILVVTCQNPPVNALGHAVRNGLMAAILEGAGDDAVRALVLRCAGRTFFAGADITEFGQEPVFPLLPELVEVIEGSPKPIVAAIHGTALGGGLEVAMACHYRVAARAAKLGMPEVKLGLLPGAGGTQRLPRLVGVADALTMIVGGSPVSAERALEIGLIDRMTDAAEPAADALAFARDVAGLAPPRASEKTDRISGAVRDPAIFDRFRQAHGRLLKGLQAPEACIAAVRAAVEMPFADGLLRERALFRELMDGDESKAQRHYFFAERAAGKIAGLDPAIVPRAIDRVGIVGAGTMGGGIALNFLSAGLPVTLVEREQAALDRGVATIGRNYARNVQSGRVTEADAAAALALLTPTLALADLADSDLVIEAVFEDMGVKTALFAELDRIVKPDAILASNTSYLDIDAIAAATARPQAVVGLHFFSPANIMRLLEVVRGARTAPVVLATAMALAKRIGKIAVVAGTCDGFIGNRMLKPRQDQANRLVLEGAKPWDVDRVLTTFGFPMGPFQMADLAGLDLGWAAGASRGETLRDAMCEADRRGQKNGRGFYDYDADRRGTPSSETEAIIARYAEKRGTPQRTIGDAEILERLLYPMVNEGARILEDGIAQRASDIDVVWVNGYGWPIRTGGPMFWADLIGLDTVVAGLERHAGVLDARGPSAMLAALAARGGRLTR